MQVSATKIVWYRAHLNASRTVLLFWTQHKFKTLSICSLIQLNIRGPPLSVYINSSNR